MDPAAIELARKSRRTRALPPRGQAEASSAAPVAPATAIAAESAAPANSRAHFLPVSRFTMLPRPDLVERAIAGSPALVVIHGGGGTGKSVLAAQIAMTFTARSLSESDVLWVRFEEKDHGPQAVWQRILTLMDEAGLIRPGTTAARLIEGGLSTVGPQTIARALTGLERPLMLVLDDAHRAVDAAAEHSLLDALELVASLRLVITTRETHPVLTAPQAALRVPLRKLSAADLVMTRAEVGELVQLRNPGLSSDTGDWLTDQVHTQTRGWPLAAHALTVELAPEATVTRSATASATRHSTLVRGLVARLLDSCSAATRLVHCASALFDEVSAPILAQILQLPEQQVCEIFATSMDSSLGHWTDDDGTRWYRHHDLMRDELARRAPEFFTKDELQAIAWRAADAFRTVRPHIAVASAIRAERWEALSDLLLDKLNVSLTRQRPILWLSDIPKSVGERYPVIALFTLLEEYSFPSGRLGQLLTGLRALTNRHLMRVADEPGFNATAAATIRMVAGRLSGNEELALRMCQRAQDSLEDLTPAELTQYKHVLPLSCTQRAITLIHAGRMSEAERALERILNRPDDAPPSSRAHALSLTASIRTWRGDMRGAEGPLAACASLEIPVGWDSSYIGTGYRLAAATACLEANDPDGAQRHVDALAAHSATIEHWPFLCAVEALIVETRAGAAEALRWLNEQCSRRSGRPPAMPSARQMVKTVHSRLQWHAGVASPGVV